MSKLMEVYDDEIELVKQEAYEQGCKDERKKVFEEVLDKIKIRLIDGLNLQHSTDCGDVGTGNPRNAYSTLMRYEVGDAVEDLLDDLQRMKGDTNEQRE